MTTGEAIAAIFECLRGESRQAALGRQDADVHASPRVARDALPRRAVRPSGPGRPRRRALLPRDARGDVHPNVGASRRCRSVRVPVAQGDRRRAGARTARRLGPRTSRCGTRSSSPTRSVVDGDLRIRGAPVRADDARVRGRGGRLGEAAPAAPAAAAHGGRAGAGARRWRPTDAVRSRRSRETSSSELGYELSERGSAALGRGRRPPRLRTTPGSPRGTRRLRACSGRRFGAAGTLALPDTGTSRPVRGDEPPVQREEVRPLGRDAGRVAAEREPPRDLAVRDAQRVGALLERRKEDVRADDDGGPEDPPADLRAPELAPVRSAKRPETSVEPAREDASVGDRRGRVAEAAHLRSPRDAARRGVERDHLARARDGVEPRAVGRWTRVEALVPERVALQVRRPELAPGRGGRGRRRSPRTS